MSGRLRLGLCQLAVTADKAANIASAVSSIAAAKKKNDAQLVVLPECFNCPYGTGFFKDYAEPIPFPAGLARAETKETLEASPTFSAMAKAASDNKVWLVAGSIPEVDSEGRLYNSSMLFSPTGELQNVHRKVHLFRINTDAVKFDEAEVLTAGNTVNAVEMADLGASIGVGICFDIRYPQLALQYQQQGTSILCYPGAFNMVTGPVHWKLAAQSRAIDNQQFAILCSPARDETAGYVAYGHSLIIDPWGEVVAEADEKETIVSAEIDMSRIEDFRKKLPILSGQRPELYSQQWGLKQ